MSKTVIYKGYNLTSSPYIAHGGGYVVHGHITDHQANQTNLIPFDGEQIYQTDEEANNAFFEYAKDYIDKNLSP